MNRDNKNEAGKSQRTTDGKTGRGERERGATESEKGDGEIGRVCIIFEAAGIRVAE